MKRNKRSGGSILTNFCKDLQNLKQNVKCKKGVYFSFDYRWYSIHFDIVH